MTLPLNRIGAARGPGGSTLDDVVEALGALNASIATLVTEVQGVRADTRSIWGEVLPAGWPGFAAYLSQRFYPVDPAVTTESLNSLLVTLLNRLTFLTGANGPSSANWGTTGLPGYLTAILGTRVQVSEVGATLYEFANFDQLNLQILAQDIVGNNAGGSTGPLEGSTYEVLRELLECVCNGNGGGGDPDNPENTAPTDLCTQAVLRNTAWDVVGTKTIASVEHTVYRPRWGASFNADLSPLLIAQDGANPGRVIIADTNTNTQLCVAWDFTGNAIVPTEVGRDSLPGSTDAATSTVTNAPSLPGGSTYTRGTIGTTLDRCGGAGTRYVAYNFAFPTSAGVPALNVFAGRVDIGCAS